MSFLHYTRISDKCPPCHSCGHLPLKIEFILSKDKSVLFGNVVCENCGTSIPVMWAKNDSETLDEFLEKIVANGNQLRRQNHE